MKFIDNPDDDDDNMQVFRYCGRMGFLNKYLIGCSFNEGYDYSFVDITSGKKTQTFCGYPYISQDKKRIMSIYTNPYEATADLELYSIRNGQVRQILSTSFKNWMPKAEPEEMFWGSDGYLYAAVNHAKAYWMEDGNFNDKSQYIRIKIL